jgi:hypothetical protein
MIHYLRVLATRLLALFGNRRADRELDDEIETRLRLTEGEVASAARADGAYLPLVIYLPHPDEPDEIGF